nr:hypothetical protein GCM10010200_060770 [Actinomadura rugatobispora]
MPDMEKVEDARRVTDHALHAFPPESTEGRRATYSYGESRDDLLNQAYVSSSPVTRRATCGPRPAPARSAAVSGKTWPRGDTSLAKNGQIADSPQSDDYSAR